MIDNNTCFRKVKQQNNIMTAICTILYFFGFKVTNMDSVRLSRHCLWRASNPSRREKQKQKQKKINKIDQIRKPWRKHIWKVALIQKLSLLFCRQWLDEALPLGSETCLPLHATWDSTELGPAVKLERESWVGVGGAEGMSHPGQLWRIFCTSLIHLVTCAAVEQHGFSEAFGHC